MATLEEGLLKPRKIVLGPGCIPIDTVTTAWLCGLLQDALTRGLRGLADAEQTM